MHSLNIDDMFNPDMTEDERLKSISLWSNAIFTSNLSYWCSSSKRWLPVDTAPRLSQLIHKCSVDASDVQTPYFYLWIDIPESWADIEQKVEDLSKKAKTLLPNLIQTCSGYLNASLEALNEFSQNLVSALEEPEDKAEPPKADPAPPKPSQQDLIHFSQPGIESAPPELESYSSVNLDERLADMLETFKRSVPIQQPVPVVVDKYEQRLDRKTRDFSQSRRYNIATFREMGFSARDLNRIANVIASMPENAQFSDIYDRWEVSSAK